MVPVFPLVTPPPVIVIVNWSVGATRPTMFFWTSSEPLKVQLARSVGVPEIPVIAPRSVMAPVFGLIRRSSFWTVSTYRLESAAKAMPA